jgi:hypothetical protein
MTRLMYNFYRLLASLAAPNYSTVKLKVLFKERKWNFAISDFT